MEAFIQLYMRCNKQHCWHQKEQISEGCLTHHNQKCSKCYSHSYSCHRFQYLYYCAHLQLWTRPHSVHKPPLGSVRRSHTGQIHAYPPRTKTQPRRTLNARRTLDSKALSAEKEGRLEEGWRRKSRRKERFQEAARAARAETACSRMCWVYCCRTFGRSSRQSQWVGVVGI